MPDKFRKGEAVYYTLEALRRCPTVASGEYVPMLSQDVRVLKPAAQVYDSLSWGLLKHVPIYKVCLTGTVVRKTKKWRFELVDFARTVSVLASEDACSKMSVGDLCVVYGTVAFDGISPVIRAEGITVEKQRSRYAVMSRWRSVVMTYRRGMLSHHDKQATLEVPPHMKLALAILEIVVNGFLSHEEVKARCCIHFNDEQYQRAVDMLRGQHAVVETIDGLGPFDYLDDLVKYVSSEAERTKRVFKDEIHRCFPFLRMAFETLNHLVFFVLRGRGCRFHPVEEVWTVSA